MHGKEMLQEQLWYKPAEIQGVFLFVHEQKGQLHLFTFMTMLAEVHNKHSNFRKYSKHQY